MEQDGKNEEYIVFVVSDIAARDLTKTAVGAASNDHVSVGQGMA